MVIGDELYRGHKEIRIMYRPNFRLLNLDKANRKACELFESKIVKKIESVSEFLAEEFSRRGGMHEGFKKNPAPHDIDEYKELLTKTEKSWQASRLLD